MGRKKKNKNNDSSNKERENSEILELENKTLKFSLASDAKRSAAAVFLFALALLFILGFFGSAGLVGEIMNRIAGKSIGFLKIILPLFLVAAGTVLLFRKNASFYVMKISGFAVVLFSLAGIFHWFYDNKSAREAASLGRGGGYLGYYTIVALSGLLGKAGSIVVLVAFFLIGIIVALNSSIFNIFRKKQALQENTGEEKGNIENQPAEGEGLPSQEAPTEEAPAEKENPDITKKEDLGDNIGHIEFVDGRDQFVTEGLLTEDEEIGPHFAHKEIRLKKSFDSTISKRAFKLESRDKKDKWQLPPLDFLEESSGRAMAGDKDRNFTIIEKTLENFGIMVERSDALTGPAVTQYSFRPAVGVKVARIMALQNDLALALAAHSIRIEAPIPGKSLIGIEIPNKTPSTVRLKGMLESRKFASRDSNLTVALGEDVSGEYIFGDLSRMPHLMIAGATGTGKSVSVNSIITTLLYQNSPDNLKLILVDPKRVELSLYKGIPHLLTDVVVENGKVVNVLKWAVSEMERRYRTLQDTGSRDILSYRKKMKEGEKIKRTDEETGEVTEEGMPNLPYIVVVIDELADLMGSHGKEVEGAIVRIAQMARAVGIHLIISTQRPSVEVITGLIKANITTRIAFQVATQIDSRTIIDMGGAEKLLGNGDMLFVSAASVKPKRIQGVYVSESEVKRVVKFWKNQKIEEEIGEDIVPKTAKEIEEFKGAEESRDDDLCEKAQEEIIRAKKASVSFLQRRLGIGYARAARIMDILEERGVVGPQDGAKPREIYGISQEETTYEDSIEDQKTRDKWQI